MKNGLYKYYKKENFLFSSKLKLSIP